MYQQNHVGMHRSDDAGQSSTEITEGLPGDFGFAAAVHPHDTETFYVIPVDGGHGRTMHEGKATVWRTRDAGSSWRPIRSGLPQENAHLGVLRQGMTIDSHDVPGLYFGTSAGQVFASADEGETWARSPATCRGSPRSTWRCSTDVADVRLPGTLTPLFPGLPRRVEVEAPTVLAAIDSLEQAVAGPPRPPGRGRPGPALTIHAYVDGERAGLDTPIADRSRLDVIAAISGG